MYENIYYFVMKNSQCFSLIFCQYYYSYKNKHLIRILNIYIFQGKKMGYYRRDDYENIQMGSNFDSWSGM